MAKNYDDMTEQELIIEEMYSHLDGIIKKVERMTSGNFMHNKMSIKLSASIVIDRLKKLGINKTE